MIAIVNIGPTGNPDAPDERVYEVRINSQLIADFTHRRGEGLAKCLKRASEAVESQLEGGSDEDRL